MVHIYLLRHAKTEQSFFKKDFDRELMEKGKHQIKKLITRLKEEKIKFDKIFSSPAKRCKQTSEIVHKKIGKIKNNIIYDDNLYNCTREYLLSKINFLEKNQKWNILIVGHNPAIWEVANFLIDSKIGHVKTCEFLRVSIYE